MQPQWDKTADDLSDSEGDHNMAPLVAAPASKFLKKKPAAVEQPTEGAKYPMRDVRPSPTGGAGSLLGKASVYTEKYSGHAVAGRGEILHLSESDMDLSFSLDDSIVAQAAVEKTRVKSDMATGMWHDSW